jgi:hypothetical protein
MKWKNRFSFPKSEKAQKKMLDELRLTDSPIDANEVTGGRDSSPNPPDFIWLKENTVGTKKGE